MVMCFVHTCKHYSERHQCKYFVFPKDPKELRKWLKLIRRKDRKPSKHSRICQCHFLNGDRKNGPTIFNHNMWNQFKKDSKRQKIRDIDQPSPLMIKQRGDSPELSSDEEAAEVMPEVPCKREKRSSSTETSSTSEMITQQLAIKTEVVSDNEIDSCTKIEQFFDEVEDNTLIEVKTEISDVELESRFISRATSVSPDHMHESEEIIKCRKKIEDLEQIRQRQSKKIRELENLLRYYTSK